MYPLILASIHSNLHLFIKVDNLLDVLCSTSAVAIVTTGEVIGCVPLELNASIFKKDFLILNFQKTDSKLFLQYLNIIPQLINNVKVVWNVINIFNIKFN